MTTPMHPSGSAGSVVPGKPGRPAGPVSAGVAGVLASGVVAGCHELAQRTGWPPESVRDALRSLVRGRLVGAVGSVDRPARSSRRGRPRVAYAWRQSMPGQGFDGLTLAQVCATWRAPSGTQGHAV